MVFASGLLLLLLFGAGFSAGFDEIQEFELDPAEHTLINFTVLEFYKLFGAGLNPSVCLNLTTEAPVNVAVGGCGKYVVLGRFNYSQVVQIPRDAMEKGMGYDTEKECSSDIQIRVQAVTEASVGSVSLFNCMCVSQRTPSLLPGVSTMEDVVMCNRTIETWNDRMRTMRFRINNGHVERRDFSLNQAIDAAIVNYLKSVCFEYQGNGFVKLTLSKCPGKQNITMLLNSDVYYGLGTPQKEILKAMAEENCTDNWSVDIESTSRDTVTGSLEVYGCDRLLQAEVEDTGDLRFPLFAADTGFMSESKKFYFNLKAQSEAVYSADLSHMFDLILADPSKTSQIRMDVESTAPISIHLSKCKTGGLEERIHIDDKMYPGYIMLNRSEVETLQLLTFSEKCGEDEDDEGLYLFVRSSKFLAIGSVSFSMRSHDHYLKIMPSTLAFSLGDNQVATRKINLDKIIDHARTNKTTIGYNLQTTERVAIFVSKCRNSKKHMIGGAPKTGLFTLTHEVVEGVTKLMNHKCSHQENAEETDGYVHIVSYYGPATGVIQFAQTRLSPKVPMLKFDKVPNEDPNANKIIRGSKENQETGVVLPVGSTEVDLKYFAYTALTQHYMNMVIESNVPVSLTFSKCFNGSDDEFTVNVTQSKNLVYTEISDIYRISKSYQNCENTISRYGLIALVEGPSNAEVTIKMVNFRDSIAGNGETYTIGNKVYRTIEIPIGDPLMPITIHVFNNQSEPVLLSASMCSPHHSPYIFWNQKLTMANIKLHEHRLKEISALAGDCKTGSNHTLYFSLRSTFAQGKITIDKAYNLGCDQGPCGDGTMEYIKNTKGWLIAQ